MHRLDPLRMAALVHSAKPQKHVLCVTSTISISFHCLQCEGFRPSTRKLACAKPQKHLVFLSPSLCFFAGRGFAAASANRKRKPGAYHGRMLSWHETGATKTGAHECQWASKPPLAYAAEIPLRIIALNWKASHIRHRHVIDMY